jgi:hypothetical protein
MPSSTVYGAEAYLLTGDRHTSYSLTPGVDSYGDACRIAENVSRMPGVSYTEAGGFEYEGAELTVGCRFVGGAAVNLDAPLPGGPSGPPRGTFTLITDPDHAPGHGFSLEVLLAVVAELDRTTCQGREPCLGDYIGNVIRALTDLDKASRFTAGEPLQYLEPGTPTGQWVPGTFEAYPDGTAGTNPAAYVRNGAGLHVLSRQSQLRRPPALPPPCSATSIP